MRSFSRILTGGVLLVTTLGLTGCVGANDAEKRVRDALRSTEKLSNTFLYKETLHDKGGDRETDVRGLVEDDFRYKARVATDGEPVLDEVVSDDALADRFLEPAAMGQFLRKASTARQGGSGVGGSGTVPAPDPSTASTGTSSTPGGPSAAEILATKRWVLDPAGAPSAFSSGGSGRLGDDPIADARSVFAYVDRAINEADRVVEWNPESLEYRKDEDPFDTPKNGSGVTRYDFIPPKLPKASQTGSGSNQVTPETRHFRKMSVYVKDKRVIRVVEKIDVAPLLDELEKIYDTKFPAGVSRSVLASVAVEALNVIRTGQGQDPIRMRDMEFSLKDLGTDVKVDMPTDTTKGSLALLENRGRPGDASEGVVEAAAVRAQATAPPIGQAAAPAPSDQAAAPAPSDRSAPPGG